MHMFQTISRRRFLTTTATLASTLQLQRAAHALGLIPQADVCKLAAEQEVGPYYVADELLRSNVIEDRHGIPLSLRLAVLDARTCKPLTHAAVDMWHCDALGLYAGFTKQSSMGPGGPEGPGGPPPDFDPQHQGSDPSHSGNRHGPPGGFGPPPENHPTDKLTFLRGIQITGADGDVRFQTIFPGFYMGRTNHVHFKVRLGGHTAGHTYAAGHTSHVGQVFFPEDVAIDLMKHEPYTQHAIHRTTQQEDQIFNDQHGDLALATLRFVDTARPEAGLHAELIVAVDPSATPAPIQRAGGPPPPQNGE